MIRISEFAKNNNVSRQSVYQKMKKPDFKSLLDDHVIELNGVKYLDDTAIKILDGTKIKDMDTTKIYGETNYQHYLSDVIDRFQKIRGVSTDSAMMQSLKDIFKKHSNSNDESIFSMMSWYGSEYIETIKLTKYEKDTLTYFSSQNTRFSDVSLCDTLKRNGHFSGIYDVDMKIRDILFNCEVVEND